MINKNFAKNQKELISTVNLLISELDDDSLHKKYLMQWHSWYNCYEKEIILPNLQEDEYYRANIDTQLSINEPVFSIQL